MVVPDFDDPRAFLDDFGIDAFVRGHGGQAASVTVRGIFDEKYADVKLGDVDMVTAPGPCFRCMQVDVLTLKKHDQIRIPAIDGVVYYLDHDPKPDGHGYVFLMISRDTDDV